jgi:hypothetical protein
MTSDISFKLHNRIPIWIPDLIFKYRNTMYALSNVFWVAFLPGQIRHLT